MIRRLGGVTLSSILFACAHSPAPAPVAAPCPAAPVVAAAPALTPAPVVVTPPPAAVASGYDQPPQNVLDVLHAPASGRPIIAPTRDRLLMVAWVTYPSITQVAEPYLKLAGVRVEPRTRRKHDTPGGYGVAPCAQTFALVELGTGKETPIALPPGGCVDGVTWAADGTRFAFRNTASDAVEVWIGDGVTGSIKRLGNARLNPMLGSSLQWMPDQKTLLVKLVPDDAGAPPAGGAATSAPSIQETNGQKGESSTYETRDTLQSKHDEDLFDYYATAQLAFLDSSSGAVTKLGKPAVYTEVDPSPDGKNVLVSRIQKPYSYVTTYPNFAHDIEVWDPAGKATVLAKLPVADRVPIAGVATGPRDHGWRSTEPATLVWAEALDGGDWNVKAAQRDKLMMQSAPFTAPAVEIARLEQRFSGLDWGERKGTALLHEYDENKHWKKAFLVDVDSKAKPIVLWDMSSDERYKDPGSPVYKPLPNGQWVVRQQGSSIFLSGQGASIDGDRPFLDRFDLKTKQATRLFRSDRTSLEYFLTFADDTAKNLLTWHQSPKDPPNVMVRVLDDKILENIQKPGEAVVASTSRAVTHNPDPTPAVRGIKQRLIKYKRKDGTQLSFTLLTPPGYVEGTRIPAILDAYPLDYASTSTAGQVSGSEQTFMRITDYRLLLLSGYAIIENAAFPIVGDPKKAYDTYLQQLTEDARAAVETAVGTGVVDPERIGVTGHSHGALMTVNLIAHTEFFRAGAATSGSYNKTLTPFGFQSERRSVWKGQDVYLKVSPFFVADKIKLPLLIMHGAEDANPGTTPLQAVKLYEAIRGNGGTARLVMLPHEPHWYSAMESNEQLAFEELRWFDKYVKNAAPRSKEPATKAASNAAAKPEAKR